MTKSTASDATESNEKITIHLPKSLVKELRLRAVEKFNSQMSLGRLVAEYCRHGLAADKDEEKRDENAGRNKGRAGAVR
jgi:hypothetical protein